jgi:hypothetical protein
VLVLGVGHPVRDYGRLEGDHRLAVGERGTDLFRNFEDCAADFAHWSIMGSAAYKMNTESDVRVRSCRSRRSVSTVI